MGTLHIHYSMYPRSPRNRLARSAWTGGLGFVRASAIPGASYVVPTDDLDQTAGLYVTDFDEPTIEEEDVGRVPRDLLCFSFPLDCPHTRRIPVFVDI